jgi:hypothetical protein
MWLHSCASGLPAIAATTNMPANEGIENGFADIIKIERQGRPQGNGCGDPYRKAAAAIAGFLRV